MSCLTLGYDCLNFPQQIYSPKNRFSAAFGMRIFLSPKLQQKQSCQVRYFKCCNATIHKNRYKDKRMCLNTQSYGAYKHNNFGTSLVVIGFDKRLGKCNTT